jgi:hypothetical protein
VSFSSATDDHAGSRIAGLCGGRGGSCPDARSEVLQRASRTGGDRLTVEQLLSYTERSSLTRETDGTQHGGRRRSAGVSSLASARAVAAWPHWSWSPRRAKRLLSPPPAT